MRRVVSLYLPTWPTDRLRRRLAHAAPSGDDPVVLVGRVGRRRLVWAADAAAQRLGLRAGLPAAQAHALVPGLLTYDATPAEDDAALGRLALWALRLYAPVVAADPPDGLVIDATGAAHLHGGEAALLADMVGRLGRGAVTARAAIAATHGAAHALARHRADPTLVAGPDTPPDLAATLAPLPVAALRLPAALVAQLVQLGLDTVGALEAQPRAPLALRFGPHPGRRLDHAHGRQVEPITPATAPRLLAAQHNFLEPVRAPEVLARIVGQLATALCAQLEAKALGARRLDLLCHRVDGHIESARIGTARPARDAPHLARLLTDRLTGIDPGYGIERMVLAAPQVQPFERTTIGSLVQDTPPDLSGLMDILANRVGHARLYRLAAVESDVPERAVRRVPPLAPPTGQRWPTAWPRPTRLLTPPEPVETLAELPDQPPVRFTWRGVHHRIRRADGPERIHGEWGRRDAEMLAVRDYFQVEDESGTRYWLFRAGNGEDPATGSHHWFLHGFFG